MTPRQPSGNSYPPALEAAPAGVLDAYQRLKSMQRAFALALPSANSAEAAAREAGYAETTVLKKAHALAAHADVRIVANYLSAAVIQRAEADLDSQVKKLLEIQDVDPLAAFDEETGAFKPMHEIPQAVRRAISGIEVNALFGNEVDEEGKRKRVQIGYATKLKFHGKSWAFDQINKIRGHYRPELHDHRHRIATVAEILDEIDGHDTGVGPPASRARSA